MRGQKSVPTTNSQSDNCISPVVNKKSPQSVITNCPNKNSIPSKYWKRSDETSFRDSMTEPRLAEIDEYINIPERGGCTSSPVYAELDAGVTINHSRIPSSLLMSGPSPYAVHIYSEVADAMRMAALGSSTALLPDASSYDNVAYLPSSNSDHYQARSLRRQRSGVGHLGSATPLLPAHQQIIAGSQTNYLTGGRPHKKSRPAHSHHISRINASNHHQQQMSPQQQQQQIQQEIESRYMSSRRSEAIYADFPLSSSSLSTFQVPYGTNFRENHKRPLPDVPGVRL